MTSPVTASIRDTASVNVALGAGLDQAPVGVVMTDHNGRILYVNPAFLAATGAASGPPPEELTDIHPDLSVPQSAGTIPLGEGQQVMWTPNGAGGWLGIAQAVLGDQGAPLLSDIDALTGLEGRLSLAARFAALRGGDDTFVLYIDLDRFKQVNDTLGHETGDALLQSAARRMKKTLRDRDVVGRMGGDEFVALICGETDFAEVERIADRLIDRLSRPFLLNGMQVLIGASIGIARGDGQDFDDALRRADVALYDSKHRGRGRATWFIPEMMAALVNRRDLEHGLRRALLLQEFVVHYQPQFSFGAKAVTGFEALVRWQRQNRLVPPNEFIPVAEETGLIVQLGAYVLDEACKAASTWSEPFSIAVNVSPLQFMDDDFLDTVDACLDRWGLDPARLELELTEALLLHAAPEVEDRMRSLRDRGIGLSLDDFGTGYASLNYLRVYPFNKIKIDQSFVREPFADDATRKIVGAVAGLGIDLGMNVIAEGVETDQQFEQMQAHGVNEVQGFLLSEPMPGEEIHRFLANWSARPQTPKGQDG